MKLHKRYPNIDFKVGPDLDDIDYTDFHEWNPLEQADFYVRILAAAKQRKKYSIDKTAESLKMDIKTLKIFKRICTLPDIGKKALALGILSRSQLLAMFSTQKMNERIFEELPDDLKEAIASFRKEMEEGLAERRSDKKEQSPAPKVEVIAEAITIEEAREVFDNPESTKEERLAAFMRLHPANRAKLCYKTSKHPKGRFFKDRSAGRYVGIAKLTVARYRRAYEIINRNPKLKEGLKAGDPHAALWKAIAKLRAPAQEKIPERSSQLIHIPPSFR
ncbi:hypothetical protein KJ742_04520 [Patescibacteria group bacterium]|nr:hypothetical protein [Patescibacteria group bacterium]MBU1683183.1 hypothetical protein [Patescibacteria group bacterium]MBU1934741.1 hypothetical protein [Patescibacteria group bacterium]